MSRPVRPRTPATPRARRVDLVTVVPGGMIGYRDANGGFFRQMDQCPEPLLWHWDMQLAARDAACELPDGSLPA